LNASSKSELKLLNSKKEFKKTNLRIDINDLSDLDSDSNKKDDLDSYSLSSIDSQE